MEQPPPIPDTPVIKAPSPPRTSLAARLLNVFASPGDVFEEVKTSRPSVANWLMPAVIGSLVGILSVIVVFSQPLFQQKLREKQEQAMEQQVKAGKMTRQQADQAMAMVEKFSGPAMMKLFGSIGVVVTSFVRLFWWGFIMWLLGRWFLKIRFEYIKAVEVAGLSSMIAVLGTIVSLLLIVNLGKMFSSLSLSLAVSDFNPENKNHLLLGTINVFNFWHLGVMSSGLARLTGVPFIRTLSLMLACWVLLVLLLVSSGMGTFLL